jgi:hypothetical protein
LINATNSALNEIELRMKQHEDLLSTHVALCAYSYSHLTKGPVKFDRVTLDSITIKGKKLGPHPTRQLNSRFYVPEGGEGIYQITFGLILDTNGDLTQKTAPVSFALKSYINSQLETHHASVVTSNAGYHNNRRRLDNDKVPGSRTIHLDMNAGDSVWLEQSYPSAENSYQLNMCVHLVQSLPPGYKNWHAIKSVVAPAFKSNNIFKAPTLEVILCIYIYTRS